MELETGKKLRTGAVIVAAGHKSKNSVFKPLLPVGDSTAIRRIIITLKRAGVSPIVVVTGDKADELEKHISNLQVICLRNEQYAVTQMFSSICMGLNYIDCLLYTSDAADEEDSVDLGGLRLIKKKKYGTVYLADLTQKTTCTPVAMARR